MTQVGSDVGLNLGDGHGLVFKNATVSSFTASELALSGASPPAGQSSPLTAALSTQAIGETSGSTHSTLTTGALTSGATADGATHPISGAGAATLPLPLSTAAGSQASVSELGQTPYDLHILTKLGGGTGTGSSLDHATTAGSDGLGVSTTADAGHLGGFQGQLDLHHLAPSASHPGGDFWHH
jgi:hypothetical protein